MIELKDASKFYEGGEVVFEVSDKTYTRRVYWDAQAGDLYFKFKGYKYFYCEFWADAPVALV